MGIFVSSITLLINHYFLGSALEISPLTYRFKMSVFIYIQCRLKQQLRVLYIVQHNFTSNGSSTNIVNIF
jgi:hypothetical protein